MESSEPSVSDSKTLFSNRKRHSIQTRTNCAQTTQKVPFERHIVSSPATNCFSEGDEKFHREGYFGTFRQESHLVVPYI